GSCPAGYQLNGSYFGSYAGHVDPGVGANFAFIASVTPEPSSIALLATGLFALAPAIARKRRRRQR
ncbi:MAG TPA: PEP-CTERM sorting domain-containing protein, partial [Gemmatimonadaceae bacterium]|nr:PEP-CTERM sorting domain-containing protein [Gemmatimonadaceae bacterium]